MSTRVLPRSPSPPLLNLENGCFASTGAMLTAELSTSDEVMIGPLPEGANEKLLRDFAKMTGELRSQHPGRHEAHWRD